MTKKFKETFLFSRYFPIYLAVFISTVAFSSIIPLLPTYAKIFDASYITIGFLVASSAIAQILFAPFWGMFSDHFGRRAVMSVGLLGMTIALFSFGLATSLFWLFVSRFIQGIFASAVMPTGRAFIADISSREGRVKAMGQIGAMHTLGIILGPALGGVLAGYSISTPFFVASVITFLNLIFVLTVLPEPLSRKERERGETKRSPFAFVYMWKGVRSPLMPLFILGFAWAFVFTNNQVSIPLLGSEKFNLSMLDIGLLFTAMGIISVFVRLFLIDRTTRIIGYHRAILLGFILIASGYLVMPYVPNATLLYPAFMVVGLGSAISRPVLSALISRETKQGQGITMGISSSFESSGRFLGPIFAGFLFSFGAFVPFTFSAIFVVVVLALLLLFTHFLKIGKEV